MHSRKLNNLIRVVGAAALTATLVLGGHRPRKAPPLFLGPPPLPVIAREFSVFHEHETTQDIAVIAREFTVFHEDSAPQSAVIAREFTAFHAPAPTVNTPVIAREFSFHNFFDCNNNGVADDLDILPLDPEDPPTSSDTNLDGIPDECVDFSENALCTVDDESGFWSCPDNWDGLAAGEYPDNATPAFNGPFSPTLNLTDDAFLDVDVTLSALRVVDNATLRVNQTGVGDMTIETTSGILNLGTIQIGDGRTITSVGDVEMGIGSVYEAIPGDPAPSGTLMTSAGSLRLLEGPPTQSARMQLTGGMSAVIANDIIGNGPTDPDDGDCTPVDLISIGDSILTVGGDLLFNGAVDLLFGSSVDVEVGGDVGNESTGNTLFNWIDGGLTFPDGADSVHMLEAAGTDVGAVPLGLIDNFAIGRLEVQSGNDLNIADGFDNDNSGATDDCTEAQYVGELRLEVGSTLTIDTASVYYVTFVDEGGTVDNISACGAVFDCIRFPFGDANLSGGVDLDDLLCALSGFADPTACPQADVVASSSGECPPDGVTDLADIFAIIDSFGGTVPGMCSVDGCVGE